LVLKSITSTVRYSFKGTVQRDGSGQKWTLSKDCGEPPPGASPLTTRRVRASRLTVHMVLSNYVSALKVLSSEMDLAKK
jgi:hypothetical protein